jgi:hypothetical protein
LTGAEDTDSIDMPQPRRYSLTTLEDCIEAASFLPFNEEGYVVVDKYFNRIKIKSPAYLMAHRLRGEGALTEKRALDLIRINEHIEYLVYFPDDKEFFDKVEDKFFKYLNRVLDDIKDLMKVKDSFKIRKDLAYWITLNCINTGICFSIIDKKIDDAKQGLDKIATDKLLTYVNNFNKGIE